MAKLNLDKAPTAKDFLMGTPEQRWKYNAELVWKVWVLAPTLLAKEEGWDRGNAFIQRWTRLDGAGDGIAGCKALGIKQRDARAAAAGGIYLLINTRMINDFKIVEWKPDLVVVRNDHCLQWEIAKQFGIAKKLDDENTFDCPAICRNWWGNMAKSISADLQVTFQPAMPEGGKYCQLKIERIKP